MISKSAFFGTVAMSLMVAACGGGGNADNTAATATETASAPMEAAPAASTGPAVAAASAAPAADSTDTVDGTKFADLKGDAVHGKAVFLQCQACHSIDAGKNMIGPSLHGIIGRHSGEIAGFQYSAANKGSGITWTPEKLFQYLENPQRVVPGTKMTFAGLPKAQDRADVIAYLESATK